MRKAEEPEFEVLWSLANVDELRLQPNWNSKDLSALKGKTIRLKFYLENAKLYAFQIKSQISE